MVIIYIVIAYIAPVVLYILNFSFFVDSYKKYSEYEAYKWWKKASDLGYSGATHILHVKEKEFNI